MSDFQRSYNHDDPQNAPDCPEDEIEYINLKTGRERVVADEGDCKYHMKREEKK